MNDWRHLYKVFLSAALKWRRVLRIRIIFYVPQWAKDKVRKSLAEELNRFENPQEEK